MPANHPLLSRLEPAGRKLIFATCLALFLPGGLFAATDITLVVDDNSGAYGDFIAQLRTVSAASLRLTQGRIDTLPLSALGAAAPQQSAAADEDSVLTGVRTRSARPSSLPPIADPRPPAAETGKLASEPGVLVAVGARAARAVIARDGPEPVLLALLGWLEYEELRTQEALQRPGRAVGVLLRDPAPAQQLALIDAVLPAKRRLGVIMTPQSDPLLKQLEAAASAWSIRRAGTANELPWTIAVGNAPDARTLTSALQQVIPVSDALLVLPGPIGRTSAAGLSVLQAAAGANLPVFSGSEAMVRAGALAALVPSMPHLAQQAHALSQRLKRGPAGPPLVETPQQVLVRTNPHVARQLGLILPSDNALSGMLDSIP